MEAFAQRKAAIIRNPNAIHPWQHVLEPLAGYLRLAERLCESGMTYAEGWNFGPNESDAKPVSWVVNELAKLWGKEARWEPDPGSHPHESNYLKLDCAKAKAAYLHDGFWHPMDTLRDRNSLEDRWNSGNAPWKVWE